MVTNSSINAPNVNNSLLVGTGSAFTALATANSGVLITSAGGVPSISSTLPAAVQGNITTVGTIGTGTWSASTIAINKGGTNATSFTQSNGIVTYNGTSLVNYAGPQIDSSGVFTNASQPAFGAYLSATVTNVTGDNTDYTVAFDATSFNRGSAFNASTGTFTAPVTGLYQLSGIIYYDGAAAANVGSWSITTSSRTYVFQLEVMANVTGGQMVSSGSELALMTAGDVARVHVQVSGGAKVVGLAGGASNGSYFSGILVG